MERFGILQAGMARPRQFVAAPLPEWARRIRALREKVGLNQFEFGKHLKCSARRLLDRNGQDGGTPFRMVFLEVGGRLAERRQTDVEGRLRPAAEGGKCLSIALPPWLKSATHT